MVAPLFACTCVNEVDAAGGFIIKDCNGIDVIFDAPARKVVLIGYGQVMSALELGCASRIIAVDTYSSNVMKETGMNLKGIGSIFGYEGRAQIKNELLQMQRDNVYNPDTDWIVAPCYPSYTPLLVSELDGSSLKGKYKIITLVDDFPTYDDVMKSISDLGKILSADASGLIEDMVTVKREIASKVDAYGLKSAPVLHISSKEKIYNASVLISMVEDIFRGVNVGKNNAKSGSSYSADRSEILRLVTENKGTVVFVDAGSDGIGSLRSTLPGVKIVQMTREGNNTGPSLCMGLWDVATALYPQYFSGDMPHDDHEDQEFVKSVIVWMCVITLVGIFGFVAIKQYGRILG